VTKVSEALAKLSPQDRARLQYAFEHGVADFIQTHGKRFIGVNVENVTFLTITEQAGAWSIGRVDK